MPPTESLHLDDETLIALVHGELASHAGGATEHLRSCSACRERLDARRAEDQELAVLLCSLDDSAPARRFTGLIGPRRRHRTRRTIIAAGLTVVAVTAAAALPFSPVHTWLQQAVARTPAARQPDVRVQPRPPAGPVATPAAGISIPAPSDLAVELLAPQEFGTMEITRSTAGTVELRASGGAVGYEVATGKILVDNHTPASSYALVLPATLRHVRVVVNHIVVFRIAGDSIIPRSAAQEAGRFVVVLGHLPPKVP